MAEQILGRVLRMDVFYHGRQWDCGSPGSVVIERPRQRDLIPDERRCLGLRFSRLSAPLPACFPRARSWLLTKRKPRIGASCAYKNLRFLVTCPHRQEWNCASRRATNEPLHTRGSSVENLALFPRIIDFERRSARPFATD